MKINKVCKKCNTEKPINDFYKKKIIDDFGKPREYYLTACKECAIKQIRTIQKT